MELIDFFEFDDDREESRDGHFSEEESCCVDDFSVAESKAFWKSQHDLLREVLSRSRTIERRIRIDTEQILSRVRSGGGAVCDCSDEACRRHCVLRRVSDRLRDAGYNSAVCKSKWKRSPNIYSGEHCFIDVIAEGKKDPVRVVIEVNFRAEFEMARASGEYNSLVSSLPEIFVGKAERLRSVIRVACEAAKRSTRDNNMHMPPWRSHKYMQSKWLGTCERMASSPRVIFGAAASNRPAKPTASMLTSALRCTAAKVVDMDQPGPLLTLF